MSQETIEKVFSRDKFSIPQYQRDYAWKKENFRDLWEDLKEALDFKHNQGHFLGTLVVSPNEKSSGNLTLLMGSNVLQQFLCFCMRLFTGVNLLIHIK